MGDFRCRLIAEVERDPQRPYYESCVAALEALTADLSDDHNALSHDALSGCQPAHSHAEATRRVQHPLRPLTAPQIEPLCREWRRGVFHSVNELITAIEDYLKVNNDNPKPFIWTATAEQILAKVARGRVALQQVESQ